MMCRCKKILPQALLTYQEGLPPHYTSEYHQAKLLAAMSLYSMQARGPASEKYAERLAADCTDYWHSGRHVGIKSSHYSIRLNLLY
jgi:hypothetical protein